MQNNGRRRSDKILFAFDQACNARREDIATDLLNLLEQEIFRENTFSGQQRRDPSDVIESAQIRLNALRSMRSNSGSSTCSATVISQALSAGRIQAQNDRVLNASIS